MQNFFINVHLKKSNRSFSETNKIVRSTQNEHKNEWIITGKNELCPMFSLVWFNSEALVTDTGFYVHKYYIYCFEVRGKLTLYIS